MCVLCVRLAIVSICKIVFFVCTLSPVNTGMYRLHSRRRRRHPGTR